MMNKGIIFMLLILSSISSIGQTRVIEKPLFGARTVDNVEIKRITLSDKETVITLDATACKGRLRGVSTGLYLSVDGQRYDLLEARGIKLPGSFIGSVDVDVERPFFDLVFPPLPRSVKVVDLVFMLSGKGLSYVIWDIQLEKGSSNELKKVPAALRKKKLDVARAWQAPVYETGRTRLEVHLLGYSPRMGELLPVSWGGLTPGREEILVDEKGVVVLEFDQFVTTRVQVQLGARNIGVVVDPGENAVLYIDVREANLRYSSYFQNDNRGPIGYYGGNRRDLNQRILSRQWAEYDSEDVIWSKDEKMDAEKYVATCLEGYRNRVRELDENASLSEEYRHYSRLEAQLLCMSRVLCIRRNFINVYECGFSDSRLPRVNVELFKYLQGMDWKNYDLMLLDGQRFNPLFSVFKTEEDVKAVFGEGYISDLFKAQACMGRFAYKLPLREEELAVMKTASSPQVVSLFEEVYARGQKAWEAHLAKPGYRVCQIPGDVPNEKLFETLLENYKGQVVFLDFWGTACVPCVKAMKKMQPVKKEFKGKPVSYVFITSESAAPLEVFQQMIPNIGGDHYRLPRKQDKQLVKQFNITGVPYYILVGKDGKVAYQCTGFMGCDKMRELIQQELDK